jgi:hypothetical protein
MDLEKNLRNAVWVCNFEAVREAVEQGAMLGGDEKYIDHSPNDETAESILTYLKQQLRIQKLKTYG